MKISNKKIYFIILVIIIFLGFITSVSYSYWKYSKKQKISNKMGTAPSCVNVEITDLNDAINLTNTSPLTAGEVEKLTPYEFSIINNCENAISYDINLEVMETENRLNSNYVATTLDDSDKKILGNENQVQKNYVGDDYTSVEAYKLEHGYLAEGETKKHKLKIWMDESAADKSDAMSKKFISKIVVTNEVLELPKLAITLNDQKVNEIPTKDKYFVSVDCGDTAIGEWDYKNWKLSLTNISKSNMECDVNFRYATASEYIAKNVMAESEEIVDDETSGHNLRYIGADPNNYVSFNNELWRIIGVINDVADEAGVIEPRLKIIRSESIGEYAWDYTSSGGYDNNWKESTLMKLLNTGAYYNRTTGTYYNGSKTASSVNFSNTGLTSESKNMISKVAWSVNLNTWTGEVGLIYPGDYRYATSGGVTTDRNRCLNISLYEDWKNSTASDCKNNDWLYNSSSIQWTMSPYSSVNRSVYAVSTSGAVLMDLIVVSKADVRPVVHLDTSTRIINGTGTSTDPFILSQ